MVKINPQHPPINPKDYEQAFAVSGFNVLRADIDVQSTGQLQGLGTIQNSAFHCYIPNTRTAWAAKAGLEGEIK